MIRVAEVMAAVAAAEGLSVACLKGPSRKQRIARARHRAMWLSRQVCARTSFPVLAARFDRKDHTTTMNAVGRVRSAIAAGDEAELEALRAASALLGLPGIPADRGGGRAKARRSRSAGQ